MENRIIKFRAWDKSTNEMNYNGTIGSGSGSDLINISFQGSLHLQNAFGLDGYSRNPAFDKPEDRFELMLFSNTIDEKGKEIFESDIIRFYDEIMDDFVCEVVYRSGALGVEFNNEFFLLSQINHPIVVGNIYQNPSLLKTE